MSDRIRVNMILKIKDKQYQRYLVTTVVPALHDRIILDGVRFERTSPWAVHQTYRDSVLVDSVTIEVGYVRCIPNKSSPPPPPGWEPCEERGLWEIGLEEEVPWAVP